MAAPASVNFARVTYFLICLSVGIVLALGTKGTSADFNVLWGIAGALVVSGFFIWLETLVKAYTLRDFSTSTFGLLVGICCAWLLTQMGFSRLVALVIRDDTGDRTATINLAINISIYASLGFFGAVLALRSSRDDFAFIIPYVRFRQEGTTGQPVVLDADTIMDGRVPAIARAGFLRGRLIVPRFVLDELQSLASSPSAVRRQRGERGIALLEKMQADKDLQVTIEEARTSASGETVQERLLQVALLLGARLMTMDENLAKVARLRGVDVLNLDELTDALKPKVAVGERVRLPLVRPGKDDHQAVGYLPDGTMLVVNHASNKMNTTQDVVVISTLQTSAGTMVFGELAEV